MEYRYQRGQIFRKKLDVPRKILNRVYNRTLSFSEYMEYQLDDKIPISCIIEQDRRIVEKFGLEKCKELDWELINKGFYYSMHNIRDILMSIDPQTENINQVLYELVQNELKPKDYSSGMREVYSDRFIDESLIANEDLRYIISKFNDGRLSLNEIVSNWELFKDKDLSFCLLNDIQNDDHITDGMLKDFMSKCGNLVPLIIEHNDIYKFINQMYKSNSLEEEHEFVKQFTDYILSNTKRKYGDYRPVIKPTDEQYKEIFKYSSMEEYFASYNEYYAQFAIKELNTLPQDYIFSLPIPFSVFLNYGVLAFVGTYGLQNVIDFDNECGHFFTKNDCEMLKLMYDMYLHYSGNEHDKNKTIHTKILTEENGKYVDRLYNKDEFYEAMKRMIVYGPSDWNYADKAPDYRDMIGEFRKRNKDLFISEQAPEDLQKLFYTKAITPELIVEHPEYIEFLNGKDLSSCFRPLDVKVEGSDSLYGYENFYSFIGSKVDYNSLMNFITEYSDVLNIVFDRKRADSYLYEVKFSMEDDISKIKSTINEVLRRLILEKEVVYPKRIPTSFKEQCPSMFLDASVPTELQNAFYSRKVSSELILSNPSYRDFLRKVDLELVFRHMPVNIMKDNERYGQISIVSGLKQVFGSDDAFDVMLLYSKYIEKIFDINKLENFSFSQDYSKEVFLDELDKTIYKSIIDGEIKYDASIPSHFKNSNPTMFLDESVSQDIRNKFHNREFTIKDFSDDSSLFDVFEKTNIACGFPESMSWIIPLFNEDNIKKANYSRIKVISSYSKIQDVALQRAFKEYVLETGQDIDLDKVEYFSEVLRRLSLSNSSEIFTFRNEIASQILKSSNPLESLNEIEDVFIRNNIPTVGKIYSCFEILHPNFKGFSFENSMLSPVLKKSSTNSKKIIVFSDLIKAAFGSNNRSVNAYLKNIEFGNNLYESIKNGRIQYEVLGDAEKKELETFCNHLSTLYNNTQKGRLENEGFAPSGDVMKDILELSRRLSPNGTLDYDLADRVIKMFCGFAGIDTLDEAKQYIKEKVVIADSRNRATANYDMTLEQRDFIKGIGNVNYLRNILQNGSVSREFLGSSAGSDATPLDTDVSIITSSDESISKMIEATAASKYGPIWFVLKNDDRFITTREYEKEIDVKRDLSKIEVFYTGALGEGHYGIRTGFASSEINYIVMEKYDPRVGLEIVMNGFYIPVADKEGKIVFTANDYDKLREKMSGLSYFGEQSYEFSSNLVTDETEYLAEQIELSNYEVRVKRDKINMVIKKSLEELGLQLKTSIDGDLTEGFVELIDTGSTGRGTNKPGDGDFDFMMRLDKTILADSSKLGELKQTILRNLGRENSNEVINTGDFRLKSVQLDDDTIVDIDITFTEKTDKVSYSTDMALQDRLATIERNNQDKYKYVVANILLAKQVLKKAEAYKPNRGEIPQGGLGGVGIENWILQNGGSFIDAAKSFLEIAEGKSFEEFKSEYQIWDFGDNHLAERRGQYAHDNFVANNMSEAGYYKMVQALKDYLKDLNVEQSEDIKK